ncbi:DUF4350 domain-containing protein [Microbacterium sp. YY-01]|uniref:DUF4350 domain-containing protein n=1 Tax=Microbacterium sp. YY-01 TaxID=3421634 RepID=UPI003D1822F9
MSLVMHDNDSAQGVAPSTIRRQPGRLRSTLGWGVLVVLVLAVAVVGTMFAVDAPRAHNGFDPDSYGPNGTRALVTLLKDEGIDVTVVRDHRKIASAVDDSSTLVFNDPFALSDDAVTAMADTASEVVILSGSSRLLRLFTLGELATAPQKTTFNACERPELRSVTQLQFTHGFTPADGVTGCYVDDEAAGLLTADNGTQRISMLDAARLFTNDYLSDDHNAALALALLGQHPHVVWYVPSLSDTDLAENEPVTLGTLTPRWVTPGIIMLLTALAAAGFWRGRRFGPLVPEKLPVVVRASETMHGRARLTARSRDAEHAAAALRRGAHARLSRRLSLPGSASPHVIADAAADRAHTPRELARRLLADDLPTTNAELVDFARALADLEQAVDHSARGLTRPQHQTDSTERSTS